MLMRLIPIAILLLLTVCLSEIFYQNMVRKTETSCWDEMSTAHREVAGEIGSSFRSNIKMLDLAADAIIMNADFNDKATVVEYLESIQAETIFDRVDIVFPNGTILVQDGTVVTDNGEKTYAELIAKGSHMSQRVPDFLDTSREVIHTFAPIYDVNNEPIAILGGTVYCSALSTMFTSPHYGENAMLFVVDMRDGNIVSDTMSENPGSVYDMTDHEASKGYEEKDFISDMLAGNTGSMAYISKSMSGKSYTYYAPIQNTDFSLVLVVQEEVMFADVEDMRKNLMWVGVAEVVLLLIFAVWTYNIMRKTMESETRAKEAELALLHQKEKELQLQYEQADDRREFLEAMSTNLPGGYHRCSTDNGFVLSFVSNSFLDITGYTAAQLESELENCYINLVHPEDRDYFMSLEPELVTACKINCAYRIIRRDGSVRWVQDSTQRIEKDGQAYYQCTLADIHDVVSDLNEAKHIAEESNLAKTTFLFNASHDIRTPMNAMIGFARIIEENPDDPKLVRETVAKITKSSQTLMTLLDEVLELARIERGKDRLNLEAVDLSEHGQNLYEMFASDMETAGIKFIREENVKHRYVIADSLKLSRVGMNFLSNAKKFTPTGGTVIFGVEELSSNETTATYRFYSKDSGIGMSKEFQARAFSQFERERTATESGVTGSGLGLSITKKIIDLMGGECTIESELGEGTEISAIVTFTISDENTVNGKVNTVENVDMNGKRVLLVEDNEFNREIAKYILEGINFTVDEAENGAVCIDKLMNMKSDIYDLILMDIQMPVMDGYTATVEIRNLEDERVKNIPIIAMTANAFDEDKKKCFEIGMSGHIGKPIDSDKLVEEIIRVFSN